MFVKSFVYALSRNFAQLGYKLFILPHIHESARYYFRAVKDKPFLYGNCGCNNYYTVLSKVAPVSQYYVSNISNAVTVHEKYP